MDLTQTQLTSLLNPQQKHVLKVSNLLIKLHEITKFLTKNTKKMIIDEYNKVHLTSEKQKIIKNIPISHPIIKLLIDSVDQVSKTGDNSKFLLSLIDNFIECVREMINYGVNTKELSLVFKEISLKEIQFLEEKNESEEKDFLRKLIDEAFKITRKTENIRIVKIANGSFEESFVVDGLILNREPEGKVKSLTACDRNTVDNNNNEQVDNIVVNTNVTKKSITTAIFNCAMEISMTETKGNLLFHNSQELLNFNNDEESQIKNFINNLNVNVIFCSGSINSFYMDLINLKEILILKVLSKYDMVRILELCGGEINQRLKNNKSGELKEISCFREGNKKFTKIVGKNKKVATIVLKDSLMINLDEYENKINRMIKSFKDENQKFIRTVDVVSLIKTKIEEIGKKYSDQKRIVFRKIVAKLGNLKDEEFILAQSAKKSFNAAVNLMCLMLETDDYLMAVEPEMKIPPRENKHWDDQC